MVQTGLVQELKGGLDRAKKAALLNDDEVVISLEGSSGEGLVATQDRVIVLKAGLPSGAMAGHKASCYWYDDIVSLEFSSGKTIGRIEVAVAGAKKTESTGGVYQAMLAENVVQFSAAEYDRWVEVHKLLLQLVRNSKGTPRGSIEGVDSREVANLERTVRATLQGENNRKVSWLRGIQVAKHEGGGWGVSVEFNAADNLSASFIRGGIEQKMLELYKAVYTSGLDVRTAAVAAYFPVAGQHGDISDDCNYKTALDHPVAVRVNWANITRQDLARLWDERLLHPTLR